MTIKMHIVIDTNVIVSGLLFPQSIPRKAFDLSQRIGHLLMSLESITELTEVLKRRKFDKYLAETQRTEFVKSLYRSTPFVEVGITITDCRDAKDNKFLELTISGNADCIISGDADLLMLNPFRGVAIMMPQEFLESYSLD